MVVGASTRRRVPHNKKGKCVVSGKNNMKMPYLRSIFAATAVFVGLSCGVAQAGTLATMVIVDSTVDPGTPGGGDTGIAFSAG